MPPAHLPLLIFFIAGALQVLLDFDLVVGKVGNGGFGLLFRNRFRDIFRNYGCNFRNRPMSASICVELSPGNPLRGAAHE